MFDGYRVYAGWIAGRSSYWHAPAPTAPNAIGTPSMAFISRQWSRPISTVSLWAISRITDHAW